MKSADPSMPHLDIVLPSRRALFYGGQWHAPVQGGAVVVRSPSTGEELGEAPEATGADVERAVVAGRRGFEEWRRVTPLERARVLRECAVIIRQHAAELALLDAANGGNPVSEMSSDAHAAARFFEFFAGLVTEMKGASIPMGPNAVNFSVRETFGRRCPDRRLQPSVHV
jgi:betaine-aldehyde dehydrogenase